MAQSCMDLRCQRAIPHNHHSWTQNKLGDAFLAQALPQKKKQLFRAACQLQTADAWAAYRNLGTVPMPNTRKKRNSTSHVSTINWNKKLMGADTGGHEPSVSRVASPHSGLPALKCPKSGCTVEDAGSNADILADFFAQQCTQPNPATSDSPSAPYPLPEAHTTFVFPHIKVKTVIHHLRRLPLYKRSGCEILTHRVLRETASLLGPSIMYLYNLSINTSSFPSEWKTAIVKPIFKHRGHAEDPTNYRPISLLPAIGKILDHIQSPVLRNYLLENELLIDRHRDSQLQVWSAWKIMKNRVGSTWFEIQAKSSLLGAEKLQGKHDSSFRTSRRRCSRT